LPLSGALVIREVLCLDELRIERLTGDRGATCTLRHSVDELSIIILKCTGSALASALKLAWPHERLIVLHDRIEINEGPFPVDLRLRVILLLDFKCPCLSGHLLEPESLFLEGLQLLILVFLVVTDDLIHPSVESVLINVVAGSPLPQCSRSVHTQLLHDRLEPQAGRSEGLANDSDGGVHFATSHKVFDLEIESSVGHLDVTCGTVVDFNEVGQRRLHIRLY